MANWLFKIELGEVLARMNAKYDLTRYEEPAPQEVLEAIAAEIGKTKPLKSFQKKILAAKSIAEANRIINEIYDEADRCRVWCGMPG